MAALALAIRLYELDRGRRPATLSDLVPDYVPDVPADPFTADNQPLPYLPDAERPRLYSVGPNGADDGGYYVMVLYTQSMFMFAGATPPTVDYEGRVIDWAQSDIPFTLDGEPAPSAMPTRNPATAHPSTREKRANNNHDVEHYGGDRHENEAADQGPEQRHTDGNQRNPQ